VGVLLVVTHILKAGIVAHNMMNNLTY